jgi:hypothetical protein
MRGAISQLPQNAFMAWCSVKKTTETTLPFYFTFTNSMEHILSSEAVSSSVGQEIDRFFITVYTRH